jgi:hypothetical protein
MTDLEYNRIKKQLTDNYRNKTMKRAGIKALLFDRIKSKREIERRGITLQPKSMIDAIAYIDTYGLPDSSDRNQPYYDPLIYARKKLNYRGQTLARRPLFDWIEENQIYGASFTITYIDTRNRQLQRFIDENNFKWEMELNSQRAEVHFLVDRDGDRFEPPFNHKDASFRGNGTKAQLQRQFIEAVDRINHREMADYYYVIDAHYTITPFIATYDYPNLPLRSGNAPTLKLFNQDGEFLVDNGNTQQGLCFPEVIYNNIQGRWGKFKNREDGLNFIISEIERLYEMDLYQKKKNDLQKKFGDKFEEMFQDDDDLKDYGNVMGQVNKYSVVRDGVSINQIKPFCEEYKINFKFIDISGRSIDSFKFKEEEGHTRKHRESLMGLIHASHIYNIIDPELRKSIHERGNSVLIRDDMILLKKEEQREKNQIVNHYPYTPENLKMLMEQRNEEKTVLVSENEKDTLIFFTTQLFKDIACRYSMKGQIMMKVCADYNLDLIYNPEYTDILKLCNLLKIPFNNQSFLHFADLYLRKVSGTVSTEREPYVLKQLKSNYHPDSLAFCNGFHSCAIVKNFNEIEFKENLVAYDINKAYTSVLGRLENYIVFDILNVVEEYKGGEIRNDTVYRVESDNISPIFHTYGVYYPELVRYGLSINVISKDDIKFCLTGRLVKTDVFQKFVKEVIKECGVYAKTVINQFVGNLQHRKMEVGSVEYGRDINSMACKFFQEGVKHIYSVNEEGIPEEHKLYCIDNTEKVDNEKNLFHIRAMIVQLSNLETYKHALSTGGKIIAFKTDTFIVENPVRTIPTDETKPGMLRQLCVNGSNIIPDGFDVKVDKKISLRKQNPISSVIKEKKYHKIYNEFNEIQLDNEWDFNEIWEKIKNKNVYIDGRGSSGKTYNLKQIINAYEEMGKSVVKLAPTHIATKNLSGKTLHSGLGFSIDFSKNARSNFKKVDVIVIDELSMCHSTFYGEFHELKRRFPHLIIIGAGEFTQLPPVGEEHIDFLSSDCVKSLFENKIELRVNKSNDKNGILQYEMISRILEDYDKFMKEEFLEAFEEVDYLTELHLCKTNKYRVWLNKKCMNEFKPERYMEITKESLKNRGDDDFVDEEKDVKDVKEPPNKKQKTEKKCETKKPRGESKNSKYAQDIYIYEGLPLRSRITNLKRDIRNGEQFKVVEYDKDTITVVKDESRFPSIGEREEPVKIKLKISKNFLNNFNPNYAMTIHSSQCQRFHENYTLHQAGKYCRRMMNVAVGRATDLSYIKLPSYVRGFDDKLAYDEDDDLLDEIYDPEYEANFIIKGNAKANESWGEVIVRQYLDSDDSVSHYFTGFRFDDCRDERPLEFDFLVNDKVLIEYDGRQHCVEVPHFSRNLADRQKKDKIKDEYCKKNGIPLLRVNYENAVLIENAVKEFLDKYL